MPAFDLPDYSKSSMAQNEKLPQERQTETGKVGGWGVGFEGAPLSMLSLSAKPNSSPLLLVLPGDLSWL